MESPPIDTRSYAELVAETEAHAQRSALGDPAPDGLADAGGALIRIFGHFASLVVERLNRAPARNQLAFLNLIGTTRLPPQPARVPLTFTLAARSPVDALVPAGTLVGAPPPQGETDDVVFETERDLVVTRSTIAAVYVSDTESDTFSERTADGDGRRRTSRSLRSAGTPRRRTTSTWASNPAPTPRTSRSSCGRRTRGSGRTGRSSGNTGTARHGSECQHTSCVPTWGVAGRAARGDVAAGVHRRRCRSRMDPRSSRAAAATGRDGERCRSGWRVGNRNPQRLTRGLSAFGETGQRLYVERRRAVRRRRRSCASAVPLRNGRLVLERRAHVGLPRRHRLADARSVERPRRAVRGGRRSISSTVPTR